MLAIFLSDLKGLSKLDFMRLFDTCGAAIGFDRLPKNMLESVLTCNTRMGGQQRSKEYLPVAAIKLVEELLGEGGHVLAPTTDISRLSEVEIVPLQSDYRD
eukprot:m.119977 g.119977  ORF g.119977 m.119977 type:complete len:101 (+) comp23208_c0_seq1:554-856(+)